MFKNRAIIYHIGSLAFLILFLGFLQAYSAWTPPTAAPPNGDVVPPLNTGAGEQTKSGNLIVGGDLKGSQKIADWSGSLDIYGLSYMGFPGITFYTYNQAGTAFFPRARFLANDPSAFDLLNSTNLRIYDTLLDERVTLSSGSLKFKQNSSVLYVALNTEGLEVKDNGFVMLRDKNGLGVETGWINFDASGVAKSYINPTTTLNPVRFGIGTTNPAKELDVMGQIHATGDICTDLGGGTGTCLSTAGGGAGQWILSGANIYNSNTGNVGIGVTNPTSKLQIATDTGVNAFDIGRAVPGLVWEEKYNATTSWGPSRSRHGLVVFDPPGADPEAIYLIGGEVGGVRKNDVWKFDGVSWTQILADGAPGPSRWSARTYPAVTAYNGKIWLMGGYDGAFKRDVWSSSDGITWTQAIVPAWSARAGHALLAHDGKMWVVGGFYIDPVSGTASTYNDFWYSTDGVNWTGQTGTWPSRGFHSAVSAFRVFSWRIYVLGGYNADGGAYLNDVYEISPSSIQMTAGANWTQRQDHNSVVFDDDGVGPNPEAIWVIGGTAGSDVWKSIDGGTSWTKLASNAPTSNRGAVVFQNKIWLISGNNAWASSWGTIPETVFKVDSAGKIVLPGLLDCTGISTLDTNAAGEIVCGSDANSGGGGGAPVDASYLVLTADVTLASERRLTAGAGISFADAGANSTLAISSSLGTSIDGSEIVDGTIMAIDIDTSQIQRRVSGSCPAGSSIRTIAVDGSVTCETDDTSGGAAVDAFTKITSDPFGNTMFSADATGALRFGASAGVIVSFDGPPLNRVVYSSNDTYLQRRVSGICDVGQKITGINQDGTVSCSTDSGSGREVKYTTCVNAVSCNSFCPTAGKVVVGGGCSLTNAGASLRDSYISSSSDWYCAVSSGSPATDIVVSVICENQ